MRNKSTRYNYLIGSENGYLKVLDVVYGVMKNRHAAVKVLCNACGNEAYISAPTFEKGKSKSCGCRRYKDFPTGLENKKTKDLTGKKFGKLTVLECVKEKSKRVKWRCKCDCGNEKTVVGLYLTQGETSSCGCDSYKVGECNPLWKGYHDITGKKWSDLKTSAKVRNLEFSIDIETIWDIFEKQEKKCALTNLDIEMGTTASLDRIDSSKGYIDGNVQWLHKNVNQMKWDLDQSRFISLCELIVENNKIKNENISNII